MYKNRTIFIVILTLVVLLLIGGGASTIDTFASENTGSYQAASTALSTAFTYQGRLTDNGELANGIYHFLFSLYDAPVGGAKVGLTNVRDDEPVHEGLFTVALDFGTVFDGTALWLEIAVQELGSTGSFTTLSPRQALTATPYALGLLPGAVISGTTTSQTGVLNLKSSRNALQVVSAGDKGMYVASAGGDGVQVHNAGNDGFHVYSAERDGLHIVSAAVNGMFVDSAGDKGLYVKSAGGDGVQVYGAGNDGFHVYSAARDGLRVVSAGVDGVYINTATDDGLHIDSAGDKGMAVLSAGGNGVYANTTQASGEWGMRTPDKISASNVTFSSLTLIAQVTGPDLLTPGDLVAVVGVADPLPGSTIPLALVRLADAYNFNSLIGVVEGHMARFTPEHLVGEGATDGELPEFRRVDGAANAGDYVALTISGVAQVKVDPYADIQPGQRLTASEVAGQARALRSEMLNGMVMTEGAPVIGIALTAPTPGSDTIPVFIALH